MVSWVASKNRVKKDRALGWGEFSEIRGGIFGVFMLFLVWNDIWVSRVQ
jgi:hypothetical protein